MSPIRFLQLLALCGVLFSNPPRPSAQWVDAGLRDGVRLSSRENPALGAFEVRAEKELPIAARALFAVVTDYGRYQEFMPGILSNRIFPGEAPARFDVYMLYSPQFVVVRARDVVLQVELLPAAGTNAVWTSHWKNMGARVAERPDAVRMPLNVGSWTIEDLGPGRSRVTYQVAVRPGGWIPDWMVRWGAARALPEVLELVAKRALKQAAAGSAFP